MHHDTALDLVVLYAPEHAGLLWNVRNAVVGDVRGCDTAWAVAHQYEAAEVNEAIADLKTLASGQTPNEWECYDDVRAADPSVGLDH